MLSLLCNVDFGEKDEFRNSSGYRDLLDQNYLSIICENEHFHKYVDSLKSNLDDAIEEDSFKTVKLNLNSYLESNKHECVYLAIACLQSFVQINWLGPSTIQASKLPMALIEDKLFENEPSNRVFNLIDHFKPMSQVISQF
jgi:hypothetical protein